MDPLSVMLGEMKALQVQTFDTVRDMSERLRRVESLQSGHEARISSLEGFMRQHQDADSREKPTIFSTTQLGVSFLAVAVTIVLGIIAITAR